MPNRGGGGGGVVVAEYGRVAGGGGRASGLDRPMLGRPRSVNSRLNEKRMTVFGFFFFTFTGVTFRV